MITERTLKKWRKEALQDSDLNHPVILSTDDKTNTDIFRVRVEELTQRILQMTQELLDQHLMRRN